LLSKKSTCAAYSPASPEPPLENLMKNMNQVMDNVVVRGVDSQTRTNLTEKYGANPQRIA
jgi:hypothetical protein